MQARTVSLGDDTHPSCRLPRRCDDRPTVMCSGLPGGGRDMDESREPGTEPAATPEGALPDEPLAEAASGDTGSTGEGWGEGDKAETVAGREWLGQLQKMIDDVATQAAPVARQVAAKAAELAAAGAAAA